MQDKIVDKILDYEDKYGILTKQLVDAVWVLDLETMTYVYITPSIERLTGFTPEELQGARLKDRLTQKSYDKAIGTLVKALNGFEQGDRESRTLELEFHHKDGSEVWLEITARFYKEKNGAIRLIGVSRDINDRKKHELEREALIAKLKDTVAELKRLQKENKVLRGLLPICAQCKKIRDESGKWWPVEEYIASRTEADFTHTICPECKDQLYPELRGK